MELHQSELMILQFSDCLNKEVNMFLTVLRGYCHYHIQTDFDFFSYEDEKIYKNKCLLKVPGQIAGRVEFSFNLN